MHWTNEIRKGLRDIFLELDDAATEHIHLIDQFQTAARLVTIADQYVRKVAADLAPDDKFNPFSYSIDTMAFKGEPEWRVAHEVGLMIEGCITAIREDSDIEHAPAPIRFHLEQAICNLADTRMLLNHIEEICDANGELEWENPDINEGHFDYTSPEA